MPRSFGAVARRRPSIPRSLPPPVRNGACEKFHKFLLRVRGAIRTLPVTVRSMPASALSLTLVLGLAACGPRLADRNIDAVNRLYEKAQKNGKDVTLKEVEAVLGQPTRIENFPMERQRTEELPGVRYFYRQGNDTIVLHFVDNKLIQRVYHFGETPVPDQTEHLRMIPRPHPIETPSATPQK